ncbi:uncharacterized protein FIBRA_05093 [Fibroporia radiculosa]|uniref:3-hydroxyacyl-CoA dehydrogenase NAD binding domain-containing protein n=1 Tax=Fibroporia radiculosa TaxID=599839 RepID=J4G8I6_9APHY|nr:uncharacterized protein FIBRA_05093 [Fibroporia radiculosa]CCM02978.1 predicted protein [Fibroporia radiculosa]
MSVAHGIRKVAVLGAGQMGLGIAFVSAVHARVPVLLYDRSNAQIQSGMKLMDKILEKDVAKGKITSEHAKEARDLVSIVDAEQGIRGIRDVDMVIEAVSENLALKQSLFRSLAEELSPGAILASNTSSISVTKIAAATIPEGKSAADEQALKNASRVVGLHFFNPVPVMKLVELISALQTSKDTLDRSRAFAVACGKEVTTAQDVPGFVSNALLMPFINEVRVYVVRIDDLLLTVIIICRCMGIGHAFDTGQAIMSLERGVATRDDIDKTLKLGMNHPMGPLQLALETSTADASIMSRYTKPESREIVVPIIVLLAAHTSTRPEIVAALKHIQNIKRCKTSFAASANHVKHGLGINSNENQGEHTSASLQFYAVLRFEVEVPWVALP